MSRFKAAIGTIESRNNYSIPNKEGSGALGKYQIMWNVHKNDISKLTGVKTENEFLKSPEAQEKYMDHLNSIYDKGNSQIRSKFSKLVSNISDETLMGLQHFLGLGNVNVWLKTLNDTEGLPVEKRYELAQKAVDDEIGSEYKNKKVIEYIRDINNRVEQYSYPEVVDEKILSDLGITIKSGEVGTISNKSIPAIKKINNVFKDLGLDGIIVTAGKDKFHTTKHPNSKHSFNKAIDFVSKKPIDKSNDKILDTILEHLKNLKDIESYEIAKVIDEYRNPSKYATGSHFHIEFN